MKKFKTDNYSESAELPEKNLSEKLRKAYFWIANHAIISPYYDIEYNFKTFTSFTIDKSVVNLPSEQSYSSYVLLPLLTLVTRKKCLLVGGPGRGKTASSFLMGVLAGYSIKEIKRGMQHGQPQMTVSDLLGNPLPSDLMSAKSMEDIKIAWRKWLDMKVKIIDEYNRIPTRTQSALLTVLADNYAEMFDQVKQCPESAWYLTANDDSGGGTYEVIEALKDRIDIVVKALHFNTRFLKELLLRIEENFRPEEIVPKDIIFTEEEIEQISKDILKVEIPFEILRRIEFFASQFELSESAAEQIEYKTKDTLKLSGGNFINISESDKDKVKDLSIQTKNGLSVRALMTAITYIKALAYFRGNTEVEFEDVKHILPFVLHDKLIQNTSAGFFEIPENQVYKTDKISWIKKLFDLSCAEYSRLNMDKEDKVASLQKEFETDFEYITIGETERRIKKIENLLAELSKNKKISSYQYDDILKLKYMHQKYTVYKSLLL